MLMTYKYTMFIVYTLQHTHMKNNIQMWFLGEIMKRRFD